MNLRPLAPVRRAARISNAPFQLGEASLVSYARAERYHVHARHGCAYSISIARPAGPPPPRGFPVIYILDADACFGTMVEAVRMQARRPARTGVDQALVIGIGCDSDGDGVDTRQRLRDFTPSTADGFPGSGGADAFLDFLARDLMPVCEQRFEADAGRRLLFGHSLGGLFALHVLFTDPALFSTVTAASPSLWWDGGLLQAERSFGSRLERLKAELRLMICVGELEQTLPPGLAALSADSHDKNMVERARELAARLQGLRHPLFGVTYHEFADENHASIVPVAISRAIRLLRHSSDKGETGIQA